jgi:uncharacterized protein DUF6174
MLARSSAAIASVLLIGAAVGACGSGEESRAFIDGARPAESGIPTDWTRPGPDYSYTVDAGCGERGGLVGWYRIRVSDGAVTDVWPLGSFSPEVSPSAAPTIADLVGEAAQAERAGADKVVVSTSPQGYPKRILIDRDTNSIDDEVCYTISDFVRESGSVRPWPKPRPVVDWTAHREVRLTTWGSSSCPWKLGSVQTRGTQSAVLRLDGPDAGTICTSDLAPHHSVVALPSRIDRGAEQLTFVILAAGKRPLVLTLDQGPR